MLCHYSSCLTVIDGLIESCLPIPYRLDQKSLAAKDVLCWVGGGGEMANSPQQGRMHSDLQPKFKHLNIYFK